jgi:hypothetical protein
LANLEQISKWLGQVHELHQERGMGWVSPYGCPEDGQQAYDDRAKCFEELQATVEAIQNNLDV